MTDDWWILTLLAIVALALVALGWCLHTHFTNWLAKLAGWKGK